jgi:hypothetical protein
MGDPPEFCNRVLCGFSARYVPHPETHPAERCTIRPSVLRLTKGAGAVRTRRSLDEPAS